MTLVSFNRISRRPALYPSVELCGVTGTPLVTLGACKLPVQGQDVEFTIVHDIQGPDVLFGVPFLSRGNLLWSQGEFQIEGKSYPFDVRKEDDAYRSSSVVGAIPGEIPEVQEMVEKYKSIF